MHSLTLRWSDQDHGLIDPLVTEAVATIRGADLALRAEPRVDRRTGALELWIGRARRAVDTSAPATGVAPRRAWPEGRTRPLRLVRAGRAL